MTTYFTGPMPMQKLLPLQMPATGDASRTALAFWNDGDVGGAGVSTHQRPWPLLYRVLAGPIRGWNAVADRPLEYTQADDNDRGD